MESKVATHRMAPVRPVHLQVAPTAVTKSSTSAKSAPLMMIAMGASVLQKLAIVVAPVRTAAIRAPAKAAMRQPASAALLWTTVALPTQTAATITATATPACARSRPVLLWAPVVMPTQIAAAISARGHQVRRPASSFTLCARGWFWGLFAMLVCIALLQMKEDYKVDCIACLRKYSLEY